MPENILVVEYEPRYADRVRSALAGQPIAARFAKDGEEAMRELESYEPKLIVLSSVVPKVSAPELIRAIRGRNSLQQTPILLTVSGYTGTAPKQDAVRMGASDILPKPYSESEFLGKVQQMLGVGQLTSNEIFGDLLHEETVVDTTVPIPAGGAKKTMNPNDDVDKLLEATLAGVMPKKKDGAPKPKTMPGTGELDKKFQDTLSGLEKSARKTAPGTVPVPKPVPAPETPAAPPAPPVAAAPEADKVPISQPIFPAAVPPLPPKEEEEPTDGTRFGQYVLLEKIATGGMAEVWKARMRGVEGFQKIVAIKKILPHLSDNQEFIEMFVDEAKLAAQLNHNNIIHIYDLGKIANSYYIAMEYVDGYDLKTILKRAEERDQPVGIEVALFVASKIAAALDYAHRKRDFDQKDLGLVHRDVSPQNVLISNEGDIKLCDFGIAKAATKVSHTQVGALKGKLQYMSPEQASGKAIDRRSDIFALAVVLFEMLTGKKLFTGENEMSILEQVREARVTAPSKFNDEVTPEVDRVVLKALQKEPGDRYQTAGELSRDIDSILYNMKPTPTAADLAIYMHRLWSAEPVVHRVVEEPEPMRVVDAAPDLAAMTPPPKAAPAPAAPRTTTAPGNVVMPAWEAPARTAPAAKKKSPVVPLSIAAVLVLGIVGTFLYLRSRGTATPPAPAQTAAAAPATTPAPATSAPAQTVAATTSSAVPAPTTTTVAPAQPVLDPAAVNQEVQRRLAAERVRLEQQQAQTRAQQQPVLTQSAAAPAIRRPEPQPVPQQATQTVVPVQTQTQPAPTVTQTTASQPPAADTAPAAPRVREGDLIASGTEGLVPGRIVRRGSFPYPAIARAQRIEGTVLLNVLVSESGQVLEVRVLKGRPGGLNEAAEQIVRRSTFSSPTKDGVRVKAWTTVPVDFKL